MSDSNERPTAKFAERVASIIEEYDRTGDEAKMRKAIDELFSLVDGLVRAAKVSAADCQVARGVQDDAMLALQGADLGANEVYALSVSTTGLERTTAELLAAIAKVEGAEWATD